MFSESSPKLQINIYSKLNQFAQDLAGKHSCLQRSVAVMLWGIIARRTPDWISGFQISPFIAHAWVEIDGVPIGEEMDLSKFQKIIIVKGGKDK
ncbi:lasso peptide biosynthesis B2 protein [Streptococcus suis]|uniref:lasso peptide biosynthesis B2 protein n=1 Tax=Streptococcus suis TaxID=1307 RepID=UPI000CF3FF97|nr:lasso peptide biosynthesis B2 protein [Streptococcus suis]